MSLFVQDYDAFDVANEADELEDGEYELIVSCNEMVIEIDGEVEAIASFLEHPVRWGEDTFAEPLPPEAAAVTSFETAAPCPCRC